MTPLEVLERCEGIFRVKKADYAPVSPWQNFEFSAMFAARVCDGLPVDDPRRSACVLIGTKLSRLMSLGLNKTAKNEKIEDTIEDAINYLAILEAMHSDLTTPPEPQQNVLPFSTQAAIAAASQNPWLGVEGVSRC